MNLSQHNQLQTESQTRQIQIAFFAIKNRI